MTHLKSSACKRHFSSRRNPLRISGLRMWSLVLFFVLGVAECWSSCQAQAVNSAAIDRAQHFMTASQRGQEIFNYLHFGTDFRGYRYLQGYPYANGSFALKYNFDWADGDRDYTEVWFVFDAAGTFDHLEVAYTSAIFNQPFLVADLSIGLIGHLIIDKYKDRLTDKDQRLLQQLVHDADAKGLLTWQLRVDQALGT